MKSVNYTLKQVVKISCDALFWSAELAGVCQWKCLKRWRASGAISSSHSLALHDQLLVPMSPSVSTADEVMLTNANEWKSNMCKPVKWTKCDYSWYIKLSSVWKVKLYPTGKPNANLVSTHICHQICSLLRLKADCEKCIWSAFRTPFYNTRDNLGLISILLQITCFTLIRRVTPWQHYSKVQHC
jgi:hypothetical protein